MVYGDSHAVEACRVESLAGGEDLLAVGFDAPYPHFGRLGQRTEASRLARSDDEAEALSLAIVLAGLAEDLRDGDPGSVLFVAEVQRRDGGLVGGVGCEGSTSLSSTSRACTCAAITSAPRASG